MANERLLRWEEKRREYLGSTIVLIFGLSSASLAFCCSLLTEDSVKLGGCKTCSFLAAVFFLILALLASLAAHFTRLQDARKTAEIVRTREESATGGQVNLKRLRSSAKRWGRMTWCMLYIQLATFCVGTCLLLLALALIFHSKIFPV